MTTALRYGNCMSRLDGIPGIATASVDHCITDPPYSAAVHARFSKAKRKDGGKPRPQIKFPSLDDRQAFAVARELCRVTRRWILIFCDEVSLVVWKDAIEAAGGEYVRHGIWLREAPMPQMSGDRPSTACDEIVIAHAPRRSKGPMEWNGGGKAACWKANAQEPTVPRIHPTQKPLRLLSNLLADFTDEGDMILDPYAGSASTLVAARAMGRSSIGWECDKATYEAADRRLRGEEALPDKRQVPMFTAVRA